MDLFRERWVTTRVTTDVLYQNFRATSVYRLSAYLVGESPPYLEQGRSLVNPWMIVLNQRFITSCSLWSPVFLDTNLDLLSQISINKDLYLRVLAVIYVILSHSPPFLKISDGRYGIFITVSHMQIAHENRVGKKEWLFWCFQTGFVQVLLQILSNLFSFWYYVPH